MVRVFKQWRTRPTDQLLPT